MRSLYKKKNYTVQVEEESKSSEEAVHSHLKLLQAALHRLMLTECSSVSFNSHLSKLSTHW